MVRHSMHLAIRVTCRALVPAIAGVLLAATLARANNCAQTSEGWTPINDLGTGLYQGLFQGGLYPGGSNTMPPAHLAAGLAAAQRMVPRDTFGNPDPVNGKVVLVSLGMSNTTGEFCIQGSGIVGCWAESFMGQAAADPDVNHSTLAIINGARSGQDARWWLDPAAVNYDLIRGIMASVGLTEAQVGAFWVKEANTYPSLSLPNQLADAYILEGRLATIARTLKIRYPNIQQVFFSSRIYAGYAITTNSPEPSAYEGGFAAKWAIESQIRQMSTPLNPIDPVAGDLNNTTVAPWMGWGPYMWADGVNPRSDGLTWTCPEFQPNDGAHLQVFAIVKVAQMLLNFLLTSPVTQTWFPAVPTTYPTAPTVTITSPGDGAVSPPGQPFTFTAAASDPEEGDLTPAIRWVSSIDGDIGTGGEITTSSLSLGTHWITAYATDGTGLTSQQSIHVTVPATVAAFRSIGAEDGYIVDAPPRVGIGRYAYSSYGNSQVGDQATNGQVRQFLSFDTSPIPDDAVILSATLKVKRVGVQGGNPFDTLGRLLVDVQAGSFGNDPTLQASDFQATATAPAAASLREPLVNGDLWSIAALDPTGVAAINKTGRTQMRLAFEAHDNGNGTADNDLFASGDYTDPAQWPELDVTYLSGSGGTTSTTTTTVVVTTSTTTSTTIASTTTTSMTTTSMTSTTMPASTTTTSTAPVTTTTVADTTSSTTTSIPPTTTTTTLGDTPVTVAFRSIAAEDGSLGESAPGSGVGGNVNATATTMQVGDQTNNAQSRVLASFDTSTLPPGAVIVSATLRLARVSLTGTNPFGTLGRLLADVQSGGFGGSIALQTLDFQASATASGSVSLSNPLTNFSWSTGTLDAAGLAAINPTGRTQVRLAFEGHDNANGVADRISFATGDYADASLWPELDVTYLAPATTTTSTTIATTSTTVTTTSTTAASTSTTDSTSTTTTSTSSTTTTTTAPTTVTLALRSIGAEDGSLGESAPGSGVGGNMSATSTTMQVGDQANNAQSRVLASFDTSTIPAGATIVSATLRLNRTGLSGANPFATLGRLLVDVQSGGFGGNTALQTSDFQASSTAVGSASLSNPTMNGMWATGTLDAAGLAAINRTGRTQVRLRFEVHDNANAVADRISFATGDHADASLWPELDVTYVP